MIGWWHLSIISSERYSTRCDSGYRVNICITVLVRSLRSIYFGLIRKLFLLFYVIRAPGTVFFFFNCLRLKKVPSMVKKKLKVGSLLKSLLLLKSYLLVRYNVKNVNENTSKWGFSLQLFSFIWKRLFRSLITGYNKLFTQKKNMNCLR